MKTIEQIAENICEEIVQNLNGRKGLHIDEHEKPDEIGIEIRNDFKSIILGSLTEATEQQAQEIENLKEEIRCANENLESKTNQHLSEIHRGYNLENEIARLKAELNELRTVRRWVKTE